MVGDEQTRVRSSCSGLLALFLIFTIILLGVHATPPPHHHINVCHFVPTEEELAQIVEQQMNQEDVNEYSHKVITIKKYSAREPILISILENEAEEPQVFLYLAQAILPSGKPIGEFKSFDEHLPMRKCGDKKVFYNDQTLELSNDQRTGGGVTFEWVAPHTKSKETVTVM
ncbi:hypothetical protein BSL78_13712 [Apostichopus japonicus]|uniref:Reelin domain-containing protein n=2 Tax=Stichopus japonicus TaxID=307972 RepID=A0A2G8KN28_STIJA|nr:hypothetical protein BSL78_13712 [Apostichopus japonicus]